MNKILLKIFLFVADLDLCFGKTKYFFFNFMPINIYLTKTRISRKFSECGCKIVSEHLR